MKYQLTEKIYSSNEDEQENFVQLKNFFKEFASRKRGNTYIDGLNGGIIIAPTKWAAKVNEEDGKDYHIRTNMNLVRFLNGREDCFDTELKAGKHTLDRDEVRKIMDNNIIVSLLSDKTECRIIMFCYKSDHSLFQIETVKNILKIAEEVNAYYPEHLKIGFFDRNGIIEEDNLTEEQMEKIEKHLTEYMERPKVLIKNRNKKKENNSYE